jgi:hypothetical protein
MSRRLNYANTEDVEVLPLFPEEGEHPRPIARTVRVWAPDGHSEEHTRENAADLCRRPGPGQSPWTYTKPGEEEEKKALEDGAAASRADDATIRSRVAALVPAEPVPPSEFVLLREEAKALGVAVEPTWGKKRLRDEIAAVSDVSEKAEDVDTSGEHAHDDDISDGEETF